ncbi:MAG: AfsR/SARP family transcriptional regulator [Mycobacteriaceae bacterium]|nr:AfsR/SARP family transcriptional regulator [Mycobacteriaceae bacterium]
MRFGVLGPLAVWTDGGEPVRVPGLKVRALLADLLIHDGEPVSADRLVGDVWGDTAPVNSTGALHVRVSQLRRALSEAEPGARDVIVSRAPGYLLWIGTDGVDARRFNAMAERAGTIADPQLRASVLSDALALWRGPALADFADEPFAQAAAARWEEQRLVVLEQQAETRLELGEHSLLAGELGELVTRYPFRERLRAAQMRALYRSGRQNEALAGYDELRRQLSEELGLDPSPELTALRQAILTQDPSLVTVAARSSIRTAATSSPATNLPRPLTGLIGRDDALNQVSELLDTERLVTLTGPGGVGKTRLAVAIAAGLANRFPNGAWLAELAALDRPRAGDPAGSPAVRPGEVGRPVNMVAELAMSMLGVRETSEPGVPAAAPLDRLAEVLQERRILLVLDNCEHVIEHAAEFADRLLQAAPGLRILATSRESLSLGGEIVWEVPPLDVPAGDGSDLAQLARSSAVQLFVARATAAVRGFALDAETGPAVAELCRRLDGIPLALELAAFRFRTLGVHGLVSRLDDRFRALGAGRRDLPARQRTLAATIDWSWQLLSKPEQLVLRRLSVHAGGCTLEAAEAVCGGDDLPASDVLDLVSRLIASSLVAVDDRAGDGPRYRLMESVAAYCVNRLYEAGEHARIRQRHAEYYLDLAERAEPGLHGSAQTWWLAYLDAESVNLRVALETAIRHEDADLALRLANALTWYRFLRGRLGEADRALAGALALAGGLPTARGRAVVWRTGISILRGDSDGWVARCDAVLRSYGGSIGGRARAEWFLGYVSTDLGDLPATEALLDRAMKSCVAAQDRWGQAAVLCTTAKLAYARGDLGALERDASRSADLFGELGDRWGVLEATRWLIGLAEMTGDYERAVELSRDGLGRAEALGLWPDVADRLSWLAWIAVQLGDNKQAREHGEQAVRLAVGHGMRAAQAFATIGLAFAARRDGSLELAEEHLNQLMESAWQHSSRSSRPLYLPMVLNELGLLAGQRGDPATALANHLRAFDLADELGGTRDGVFALEGAAGVLAAGGRYSDAARLLGAAAATRRATRLPFAPAERLETDRIAGLAQAGLGQTDFAAAFAEGGDLTMEAARSVAASASSEQDYLGP